MLGRKAGKADIQQTAGVIRQLHWARPTGPLHVWVCVWNKQYRQRLACPVSIAATQLLTTQAPSPHRQKYTTSQNCSATVEWAIFASRRLNANKIAALTYTFPAGSRGGVKIGRDLEKGGTGRKRKGGREKKREGADGKRRERSQVKGREFAPVHSIFGKSALTVSEWVSKV